MSLELAGMNVAPGLSVPSSIAAASSVGVLQAPLPDFLGGISIWFAVPKRKHTKSRKRMKTTVQKRIPLKKNIVFDPRTGEVTLQHKLPFNWKDYLPKIE
jgi:ribosomal protein L32